MKAGIIVRRTGPEGDIIIIACHHLSRSMPRPVRTVRFQGLTGVGAAAHSY